MLSLSAEISETSVDLGVINGEASSGRGEVAHALALMRFGEAIARRVSEVELAPLRDIVVATAAQILQRRPLRYGFWFNEMAPGHRTSLHAHEEDDELLSAVYYIRVPEQSGDLLLHDSGRPVVVHPQEGKLVMFSPSVLHEVSVNRGSGLRLSVGMNVGPADGVGAWKHSGVSGQAAMEKQTGTSRR